MKHILLLRHLESTKNLNSQFSSSESKESLTEYGKSEGVILGKNIAQFIQAMHLSPKRIYCADSKRAFGTAEFIANTLSLPIVASKNLCSSSLGIMQGKTENEVRQLYPLFIKQLELYRVGLYNSYEFEEIEGRESKETLEKRIMSEIDNILEIKDEDTKIIVLHRSSLNCTLINLARRFYRFSTDFWPSPATSYGGIYWIELKEKNDEFSFKGLNVSSSKLLEIIH